MACTEILSIAPCFTKTGGTLNKRCYQVKLIGRPAFSMIVMEDDVDAMAVCVSIFGLEAVEWVN
jgi:hypothetical protein